LPTGGVGLLFACFQRSIVKQFAFMQKTCANNVQFKLPLGTNPKLASTGLDPLIGQALDQGATSNPQQNWRKEYGGTGLPNPQKLTDVDLRVSHNTSFNVSQFIRFRGGEFFFAPSVPFLLAGGDGSSSQTRRNPVQR
jgi:deferrochelatase/peroxidase EfeB